MKQTLKNVH